MSFLEKVAAFTEIMRLVMIGAGFISACLAMNYIRPNIMPKPDIDRSRRFIGGSFSALLGLLGSILIGKSDTAITFILTVLFHSLLASTTVYFLLTGLLNRVPRYTAYQQPPRHQPKSDPLGIR